MRCLPSPTAAIAALFAVVALVSAAALGPLHAQPANIRIGVLGHLGTVSLDSASVEVRLAAKRAQTFSAVSKVFTELKVTIDVRDSLAGAIGAANVPMRRQLAGERMSNSLSCGRSMTGLKADTWRVYVSAFAFVQAIGADSTSLRIALVGGAQDLAGNSTEPVACASTGTFERIVAERVRKILEGATSP